MSTLTLIHHASLSERDMLWVYAYVILKVYQSKIRSKSR